MKASTEIISPHDTADFLLVECRERGDILTNLKLQKLLYYAQAWHLTLKNKPLFAEDFQAWVHGPVLPSQYQRFKKNEWRPILDEITLPKLKDSAVANHLVEIVNVFGVETASALELMTHNEQPWKKAREGIPSDAPSIAIITQESMAAFYKTLQ